MKNERHWIKLTAALILDDDGFRALPDDHAIAYLRIYALVGRKGLRGYLPGDPMAVGWTLHRSPADTSEILASLEESGLLSVEEGGLHVLAWDGEQFPTTDAERKRIERSRKRTVTDGVTDTVTDKVTAKEKNTKEENTIL